MDRDEVNELIDQKIKPLLDRIQYLESELSKCKKRNESNMEKFPIIRPNPPQMSIPENNRLSYGYISYPERRGYGYADGDEGFFNIEYGPK